MPKPRALALTPEQQGKLADASQADYDRYLVRRAVEFEAMPEAEQRALRGEYFGELACLSLRLGTAEPEQRERIEQLLIDERARVGVDGTAPP